MNRRARLAGTLVAVMLLAIVPRASATANVADECPLSFASTQATTRYTWESFSLGATEDRWMGNLTIRMTFNAVGDTNPRTGTTSFIFATARTYDDTPEAWDGYLGHVNVSWSHQTNGGAAGNIVELLIRFDDRTVTKLQDLNGWTTLTSSAFYVAGSPVLSGDAGFSLGPAGTVTRYLGTRMSNAYGPSGVAWGIAGTNNSCTRTDGTFYYDNGGEVEDTSAGYAGLIVQTTPDLSAPPGAPVLSGSIVGVNSHLTWTVPSSTQPILGYNVTRVNQAGGDPHTFSFGPGVLSYTEPATGRNRTYTVTAWSAAGTGDASNAVTLRIVKNAFGDEGSIYGVLGRDGLAAQIGITPSALDVWLGLLLALIFGAGGAILLGPWGAGAFLVGGIILAFALSFFPIWVLLFVVAVTLAGLFLVVMLASRGSSTP